MNLYAFFGTIKEDETKEADHLEKAWTVPNQNANAFYDRKEQKNGK